MFHLHCYDVCRGDVVDAPILDASRWVYECEVVRSVETGESTTFFCRIKNIQIDEQLECAIIHLILYTFSAKCQVVI